MKPFRSYFSNKSSLVEARTVKVIVEVVNVTKQKHHDVIIIGAGAAGLCAGLVLARAQADVVIIDSGKPRNGPASHMQGFVSRDGTSPAEFLALARED